MSQNAIDSETTGDAELEALPKYVVPEPFLREHKRRPRVDRDGFQAWLGDEVAYLKSIDRTSYGDGFLSALKRVATETEGAPDHMDITARAERAEGQLDDALAGVTRLQQENRALLAKRDALLASVAGLRKALELISHGGTHVSVGKHTGVCPNGWPVYAMVTTKTLAAEKADRALASAPQPPVIKPGQGEAFECVCGWRGNYSDLTERPDGMTCADCRVSSGLVCLTADSAPQPDGGVRE